jgi:ABC-type phosphate transport system permease subunit
MYAALVLMVITLAVNVAGTWIMTKTAQQAGGR